MRALRRWRMALPLILCAIVSITASAYWHNNSTGLVEAANTQDTTMLERRISQLEQRFYTIETSINRLEQRVSFSERQTVTQPAGRDTETTLLRSEVEALQRRLSEIECGLAKLDERTLSPAALDARRKSSVASTDPCRLNPETPLRLSARP
jgi:hypothetical protein